jgi:sugar phosphate isomerase/epimerase
MKRRNFIKNTVAAVPALGFKSETVESVSHKTSLEVLVMGTSWGFEGGNELLFSKLKKEGFDGVELWWPAKKEEQKSLYELLKRHNLKIGFLVSGSGQTFDAHLASFKNNLDDILANWPEKPEYINCHSGKDYFSQDQNSQIIAYTIAKTQQSEIEILHETHRGRMCFAAHITRQFLEKHPKMNLTLDISHWCNVHESLLEDQAETLDLAFSRVKHIHARVGHQEGPQVSDPRAPEWATAMERHLSWWDSVIKHREKSGDNRITFLTEFGPPNYMPTLPYTKQPVGNQWEINVYMLKLLKERYA